MIAEDRPGVRHHGPGTREIGAGVTGEFSVEESSGSVNLCASAGHPLGVVTLTDGAGTRPYMVTCGCGESGQWEVPRPAELARLRTAGAV